MARNVLDDNELMHRHGNVQASNLIDDLFFSPDHVGGTILINASKNTLFETRHCVECGNTDKFYDDPARGESVCVGCGNVVDHHAFDYRGIRIYENRDERVHYEPLSAVNRPVIPVKGGNLDAKRRALENNKMDWKVKRIVVMKIEMEKLKTRLPFPKDVEDITMEEIKRVFSNDDILTGRAALPMAIALLYYSCIKCNASIGLRDILDSLYVVANDKIEEKRIRRGIRTAIKTLSKEMGYKFITKNDHSKFLMKMASDLGIPQYICTDAIKKVKEIKARYVFSGNPTGYAAACLFQSCVKHGMTPSIKIDDIAKASKMTDVTILRRVDELKPFFTMIAGGSHGL